MDQFNGLRAKSHTSRFVLFVVALLLCAWLAWDSVGPLMKEWSSGLYSQGWLIFALSIGHLYQIRVATNHWRWVGLLLMAGAGALWWLGLVLGIETIQYAALFGVFLALVVSVWGLEFAFQAKYMLIALGLAFPVWEHLQEPLQALSTIVSVNLLRWFGVPVLQEGFLLTVPGGRFLIEPACAGLAFILTALSLVFLFRAWFRVSFARLVKMLAVSMLLAIVANWIRVVAIVLIGNYSQMQNPMVDDHAGLGWVIFGLIYCPYFWFQVRYHGESETGADQVQPFALPELRWVVLAVLMLALFPFSDFLLRKDQQEQQSLSALLSEVEGLQAAAPFEDWQPDIAGAEQAHYFRIKQAGQSYWVYIAETNYRPGGKMLIKSGNRFFEPGLWQVEQKRRMQQGAHFQLRGPKGYQRELDYAYVVAGQPYGRLLDAKKALLQAYLTGRDQLYLVVVMQPNRIAGFNKGTSTEGLVSRIVNALSKPEVTDK